MFKKVLCYYHPSKNFRVLFRQISSKFSTNSVNFLIYFCNIREISWTKLYFSAWNFSLKDETKPELFLFFSGSFSAQILQEMLRKTVDHYSFIFQIFYTWFFFFPLLFEYLWLSELFWKFLLKLNGKLFVKKILTQIS